VKIISEACASETVAATPAAEMSYQSVVETPEPQPQHISRQQMSYEYQRASLYKPVVQDPDICQVETMTLDKEDDKIDGSGQAAPQSDTREKLQELEGKNARLERDYQQLKTANANLAEENKRLETELSKAQMDVKVLTNKLADSRETERNAHETKIANLEQAKSMHSTEMAQLQTSITAMKEQIAQKDAQLRIANERIGKMTFKASGDN